MARNLVTNAEPLDAAAGQTLAGPAAAAAPATGAAPRTKPTAGPASATGGAPAPPRLVITGRRFTSSAGLPTL
eukprot:6441916-Pyramimonas_sp.AAC.1